MTKDHLVSLLLLSTFSSLFCQCYDGHSMQRLEINTHVGDFWFIIDAVWMNRWINFVLGQAGPPGPITNMSLFERAGEEKQRHRECESALSSSKRFVEAFVCRDVAVRGHECYVSLPLLTRSTCKSA